MTDLTISTRRRRHPGWLLAPLAILMALAAPVAPAHAADGPAVFHTSKGTFSFRLEIAETERDREIGLMNRRSLAPDAGMLFDFHTEQPVAFWMENTYIPLDMVFMAADGTVRSIHADAIPMDETPIPSGSPVRFVLEIAGGRAAEIGLRVGDKMQQSRVTPAP
jgi:uncharacterized membrane protein (UPF0127 family)